MAVSRVKTVQNNLRPWSPGCDQMDGNSANLNTERGARLTLAALTERMTTKKDELETFLIANEGSRAASDFYEEGSGAALVDGQESTRRRIKNLLKQTWREYKNSFGEYRASLTKMVPRMSGKLKRK